MKNWKSTEISVHAFNLKLTLTPCFGLRLTPEGSVVHSAAVNISFTWCKLKSWKYVKSTIIPWTVLA